MDYNDPTTDGPAEQSPVNALPDPSVFTHDPDAPPRKRKKRHLDDKKADISINSLLDVLSVILVFLLKSYSSSNVVIKPSKDLNVPSSYTQLAVEESTAVTVTKNFIILDDKPVVNLEDGKVLERDVSHSGMLIEPLFNAFQEEVQFQRQLEQKNPQAPFKGIVTIISDRYVPSNLIMQVMYTAGQAEYSKFKFLLVKLERS